MSHLGDRITDLVDGQLSAEAQERAHAHLARCPQCRASVEAERLMKARLAGMPAPEPSEDLTQRLLSLGGPQGPLAPRVGHVPGSPRPRPADRPGSADRPRSAQPVLVAAGPTRLSAARRRPFSRVLPVSPRGSQRPPAGRTRRPGRTRLAVAVLGTLGVFGLGGVVHATTQAGGDSPPTVVPPVDSFVLEHATTSGDLPFADVPAGWDGVPVSPGDVDRTGSQSSLIGSNSGAGR
ncbi:MAG: hypothetical protein QG608_2093 [Actinomycetota bacterium]|nr:hypothetical protein [Actinomycetota bacterium]